MATDVRIEPATLEHVADLAYRMRLADRREIWAADRSTPFRALQRSLRQSSEAWAGIADSRVQCMFGVAPLSTIGAGGIPWMLGSEDLPKYAVPFLRRNREYVSRISERYRVLTNHVDARNTLAVRWLRWLQFDIMPAIPYGFDRVPFHPFEMIEDDRKHSKNDCLGNGAEREF